MLIQTATGRARWKLIRRLVSLGTGESEGASTIEAALDDSYVQGIPFDTDILITVTVPEVPILKWIVRTKGLKHFSTSTEKLLPLYAIHIHGKELDTEVDSPERIMPYVDIIGFCSIIEYKVIDPSDVPLFINWFWLSPILKRRLFKM